MDLFERQRDGAEVEWEGIFHLMLYSSIGHGSQNWARPKVGKAWNSIQVSHVGGRGTSIWAIFQCLPRNIKSILKWHFDMGCWHYPYSNFLGTNRSQLCLLTLGDRHSLIKYHYWHYWLITIQSLQAWTQTTSIYVHPSLTDSESWQRKI